MQPALKQSTQVVAGTFVAVGIVTAIFSLNWGK